MNSKFVACCQVAPTFSKDSYQLCLKLKLQDILWCSTLSLGWEGSHKVFFSKRTSWILVISCLSSWLVQDFSISSIHWVSLGICAFWSIAALETVSKQYWYWSNFRRKTWNIWASSMVWRTYRLVSLEKRSVGSKDSWAGCLLCKMEMQITSWRLTVCMSIRDWPNTNCERSFTSCNRIKRWSISAGKELFRKIVSTKLFWLAEWRQFSWKQELYCALSISLTEKKTCARQRGASAGSIAGWQGTNLSVCG